MEGQIFVGIIEDWLRGLSSISGSAKKVRTETFEDISVSILSKDFERFKRWFSLAMRVTEVSSGNIPVNPEDVVFRSAMKKTDSMILKALSMFTDKELSDLFGPEKASQIRSTLDRTESQSKGSTLLRSPSEIAQVI